MPFKKTLDRLCGSIGMLIAITEGRVPEEYRTYVENSIRIMESEGRNLEEVREVKRVLYSLDNFI